MGRSIRTGYQDLCKRISLLNLPTEILEGIHSSVINPSVAEELIPLQIEKRKLITKLVIQKKMTSREARQLVKKIRNLSDSSELTDELDPFYQGKIVDIDARAHHSFDKSITTLKIALSKIATIIEGVEENWIVYEILMQHKNMLNAQIDLLIKERKKL